MDSFARFTNRSLYEETGNACLSWSQSTGWRNRKYRGSGIVTIYDPPVINYSRRVAGHLNERGRRPVRGKRNRLKIVLSQKPRANNLDESARKGERDRTIARLMTIKRSRCSAFVKRENRPSLSGIDATYHAYYELNEKEVNSVAAKTVDSSGYFQLET